MKQSDLIWIASITKPVGLKGEVKVRSKSSFIDQRFAKNSRLWLADKRMVTVEKASFQGEMGRVKFVEFNHIEQVEALRNMKLYVLSDDLKPLANDEFYYHQLLNLAVFNQHQQPLGHVLAVEEIGPQTLMTIADEKGSFLVPFNKFFVLEVNLANHYLIINEIENLR